MEKFWKSRTGTVEVAPGVKLFSRGTTVLTDYHGYDVEASVAYNGQRLEVIELCVRQRAGGAPVTGEGIRKVAVAAILRDAVSEALTTDGRAKNQPVVAMGMLTTAEAERLKGLGPALETLKAVAKVYRLADAISDPPTKAVRETFGISQSTAGAWIGRARSAGLIPPVESETP